MKKVVMNIQKPRSPNIQWNQSLLGSLAVLCCCSQQFAVQGSEEV